MTAVTETSDEGKTSVNSLSSPRSSRPSSAVPPADFSYSAQAAPTMADEKSNGGEGMQAGPCLPAAHQSSNGGPGAESPEHQVAVSAFAAQAGRPQALSAKQMQIPLNQQYRETAGPPSISAR